MLGGLAGALTGLLFVALSIKGAALLVLDRRAGHDTESVVARYIQRASPKGKGSESGNASRSRRLATEAVTPPRAKKLPRGSKSGLSRHRGPFHPPGGVFWPTIIRQPRLLVTPREASYSGSIPVKPLHRQRLHQRPRAEQELGSRCRRARWPQRTQGAVSGPLWPGCRLGGGPGSRGFGGKGIDTAISTCSQDLLSKTWVQPTATSR
jgi:hypothetical protein